jgi:hypothetical protein
MKKVAVLIGATLLLVAQAALAQAPPDTSAHPTQTPPPVVAPPVTPPPVAAPPVTPPPTAAPVSPPPAAAPASTKPTAYRFGSISGSYLKPTGDFKDGAGSGWAITLEGFQFISPTKKIAIGSQVGYQSFGEKNGVSVSNFPVDALLKIYPKPGTGKADLFFTGGLGFNYTRTDVGLATNSDYYFGTQAGGGLELHTKGPASLVVDAVYHWIFAQPKDINFIALRGGLVIPMTR